MPVNYYGTTGSPWYAWNTTYSATTTTSWGPLYDPWPRWNTISTTSVTYNTWYQWNDTNTVRVVVPEYTNRVLVEETPEQVAARIERQRRLADEYSVSQARQLAAKAKARDTLLEHLSDEQRRDMEQFGSFTVVGSDGRTYLIHTNRGASGNVEVVQEGRPILRLCAHPQSYIPGEQDPLPLHDHFFGQMLAIMHDAEGFCRIANVHWRAA